MIILIPRLTINNSTNGQYLVVIRTDNATKIIAVICSRGYIKSGYLTCSVAIMSVRVL